MSLGVKHEFDLNEQEKKHSRKIFLNNRNIFVERTVFMGSFGSEQFWKLVPSMQEL